MLETPTVEGVLNLVDPLTQFLNATIELQFWKAPSYTRRVAKMWFHADSPTDKQCWDRYTVPNRPSYSIVKGTFEASGVMESAWFHTHRARSKSVFLFRGKMDEFQCEDIICTEYFATKEKLSSLERFATRRKNLLCSEIHSSLDDVAYSKNGMHYDRLGDFKCKSNISFYKNETWSMLILHYPYYNKNDVFYQHTNIFMYFTPFAKQIENRALRNIGQFLLLE